MSKGESSSSSSSLPPRPPLEAALRLPPPPPLPRLLLLLLPLPLPPVVADRLDLFPLEAERYRLLMVGLLWVVASEVSWSWVAMGMVYGVGINNGARARGARGEGVLVGCVPQWVLSIVVVVTASALSVTRGKGAIYPLYCIVVSFAIRQDTLRIQ